MIKFPYGRRDFYKLITENYLYVDRTQHIRSLEDWGNELLFLRPRRFGKSLWLSTLMNYYDVSKADDFERLFGHLAIGQDPTPRHNHYLVMRWDFSTIRANGTLDQIFQSLNNHINVRIRNFQRKYRNYLDFVSDVDPQDSYTSFDALVSTVQTSGHELYLFVDEYDNFANEVFMKPISKSPGESLGPDWYEEYEEQQKKYIDLVKGEGIFKTLFKNLKSVGSGEPIRSKILRGDRISMTSAGLTNLRSKRCLNRWLKRVVYRLHPAQEKGLAGQKKC